MRVSRRYRITLWVLWMLAGVSVGVAVWSSISVKRESGTRTRILKSVNEWSVLRLPVLPEWDIQVNEEALIQSQEDPRFRILLRVVGRGVPPAEARDESRLAEWMANFAKVGSDKIKRGALMGGTVPLARVTTKGDNGIRNSYRMFVVHGYRFLAVLTWHEETEGDRQLKEQLGVMFQLIDVRQPRPEGPPSVPV